MRIVNHSGTKCRGLMKILSPHEWAILDALEVGNPPLEIFFAGERDYVTMLNVPWHGLGAAACHRALASLLDAAYVEMVRTSQSHVDVRWTILGSNVWAEQFVLDLDRYIDAETTFSRDGGGVTMFVCTSRRHLQLFREAVRSIVEGRAIQLGDVEETDSWQPYPCHVGAQAFEFRMETSSRDCMIGSPVADEIWRACENFCEGWRKPHIRFDADSSGQGIRGGTPPTLPNRR